MQAPPKRLLQPDEPSPVIVERASNGSPFVFTCEHAGTRLPRRLGDLGLDEAELHRHIAWDIGARDLARALRTRLDATLVAQIYSRLVIDCNRPLRVASSIPAVSENTEIPGNLKLTENAAQIRRREIFEPYHEAIRGELDQRERAGLKSVLVSVHSFTPVFKGVARRWHIGVLFNRYRGYADQLIGLLAEQRDLSVAENRPYSVSDDTDYTIPVHGERRGIPHVMLEIRNDLIADRSGQLEWAERLADLLPRAHAALRQPGASGATDGAGIHGPDGMATT